MRSAPSPKKKTSPLVWVGLAALVVVAYTQLGGGDPGPVASKPRPKKATSAKDAGLYTKADNTAKFTRLAVLPADSFNPLVKKAPPVPKKVETGPGGIPADLTGGQGTWYYTGIMEIDGGRQALLENPTTGDWSYVKSGQAWKKARIGAIDVSSVVLVGPDGKDYPVAIQSFDAAPGKVATAAKGAAAGAPLNVPAGAISGAIGVQPVAGTATMTLPNGTTVQVPLDPNAVAQSANGNNNGGNNRRRNRRNRNSNNNALGNNPGDPNAP